LKIIRNKIYHLEFTIPLPDSSVIFYSLKNRCIKTNKNILFDKSTNSNDFKISKNGIIKICNEGLYNLYWINNLINDRYLVLYINNKQIDTTFKNIGFTLNEKLNKDDTIFIKNISSNSLILNKPSIEGLPTYKFIITKL
jgi:hypothetical protein